ncbi:MAG: hypothetical protein V4505_23495 [Pseudomonadota bacterium]
MTRWTFPTRAHPAPGPLRRPLFLHVFGAAALGMALAAGPALAQTRPFPDTALRGRLLITNPPAVQLDGHADQLSPGARIRDTQNLFVTSGALAGQDLIVNYRREPGGQISEVWVLTPAEAAVKRATAAGPSLLDRLFGS